MPDKKQTKTDIDNEMNFDDLEDLNDSDLEFGDLENIEDDRNPSKLGVAKELATETGNGFLEGLAKQTAKKALPPEYTANYYEAMDYVDFAKDTFEVNKSKVQKSAYRLGKEVKKILPFQIKMLDRFLEKTEADTEQNQQASEEQMREASTQSVLSGIFDKQLEIQKALEAKRDAEDAVEKKERISMNKMNIDVLSSIDANVSQNTAFSLQISKEYFRRSLELQFKSYYVQADMLRTMRDYYKGFSLQFENIVKNTGLPEFVKLNNTERLSEILRTQAVQGISKKVFDQNKYVDSVKTRVSKLIEEKVTAVTDKMDAMTDIVGGLNSATEMGGSKTSILGGILAGMGGTTLGEKLADKISPQLKEKIKNNKAINAGANVLGSLASSPSTLFGMLRDKTAKKKEEYSDESSPLRMIASKMFGGLNEVLNVTDPGAINAEVKGQSILGHNKPAIFDNKVHRSITEVIPMYLAKILRENTQLTSMYQTVNSRKTAKMDGAKELMYDYDNRELTDAGTIRDRIESNVLASSSSKSRLSNATDTMLSSSLTELSKDKKANKDKIKLLSDKKTKKLLETYLTNASKKDDLKFDYTTLVEDAAQKDTRPIQLQDMFNKHPELEKLLEVIKDSTADTSKKFITNKLSDTKRVYPIEGVKGLFSGVSRIVGSKLINTISNEQATIIAKAFTSYIINVGKDVVLSNIVTGEVFKFLSKKDMETLKDTLKLFITEVKTIEATGEYFQESNLLTLLTITNRSLKENLEVDPDVFRTLHEYSPSLVGKGKLTVENLVERKLSTGSKSDPVDFEDIRSIVKSSKVEIDQIKTTKVEEWVMPDFMKKFGTAMEDIKKAGTNPIAIQRAVIKNAKIIGQDIKKQSKEQYDKAMKGLEGISETVGKFTEETAMKSINTLIIKLINTEKSLGETIQAEIQAKEEELKLLLQTKDKLTESVNDPSGLADIERTITRTTRWYDMNIKNLQSLQETIKKQRESLTRIQNEGIKDTKEFLTRIRGEISSAVAKLKELTTKAEEAEKSLTAA